MKIKMMKLCDIKPYENNPRRNDEAIDKVAESIKSFGFQQPLVIDKDNVIVVGHTRYEASKQLKLDEVPCVVADELTEEQAKAYRLADNKTGEFSAWDFSKLDLELADLSCDMSVFGFYSTDDIEIERKDIGKDFTFSNNLVVECASENEQQELYDELIERGFTCRIQ